MSVPFEKLPLPILAIAACAGVGIVSIQMMQGRDLVCNGRWLPSTECGAPVDVQQIRSEAQSGVKQLSDQKEALVKELAVAADAEKSEISAAFSSDGKLQLGDKCFRPRTLVMCYYEAPGEYDHMTWIENQDECQKAGFRVGSPRTFLILGEC
ncbi:MAG: hypothetical protein HC844_00750 [Tabrizicola sp.]|nr:hypothetical protein [Tabrizicola sp.]